MPWWGLVSSAAAPVLLVGGWTLAARLQPHGFDAVTATISALAARGAVDRWVMTLALLGVALAHVTTAFALRRAAPAGRISLAVGGVATALVAIFPLPAGGGPSAAHTFSAAVSFTALAVWPAFAWRRGRHTGWALRPSGAATGGALLTAAAVWFWLELSGGAVPGLAERIAAGAQALWPLVVVLLEVLP